MEVRRNDPSALPAFAAMNIAWIEDLHFVEESDQKMADHPEVYIESNNSVFSVHNEIEFAATTEKQNRESILDAFGYLNLVAKLYLNHSINISMLRTFEGVMIKFLNDRKVQRIYTPITELTGNCLGL